MINEYHFVGLRTLKTFLFSLIAAAIPFTVYLIVWQSLDLYQEIHYNALFSKLIPLAVLLTIALAALGFYFSLTFVSATTTVTNCQIKIVSPLRLFIPLNYTFRWDEVTHYELEYDIGNVLLVIQLSGGRTIEFNHSILLKGEDDFRALVSVISQNTGL